MNWIAVCLLSLLPLSSPTKVDEACRLKLNLVSADVQCQDEDCTPCNLSTLTMGGKTIYSCLCSGGNGYNGSCWGKAEDDGNEIVLVCYSGSCECVFADDGTWTWCTCD